MLLFICLRNGCLWLHGYISLSKASIDFKLHDKFLKKDILIYLQDNDSTLMTKGNFMYFEFSSLVLHEM